MGKKAIFLFLVLAAMRILHGYEPPPPHLVIGGGYLDAGSHSGGLFQLEYRFGRFLFCAVRPQIVVIAPEFHSLFAGAGIGAEFHFSPHILFIPSFAPGVYFKGSGKDLGYWLEFRSSIEVAYEWTNRMRLGGQFYHISNASLGNHNPGVNAVVAVFSIPLCRQW